MAISAGIQADKPEPYAPAGDIDSFFEELDYVPDPSDGDDADDETVLPVLDAAFDELAASIDEPAGPSDRDARRTLDDDAFGVRIERHRADFEELRATTSVDPEAVDDDPSYLTNDLYRVPPRNTRFEWVDDDSLDH